MDVWNKGARKRFDNFVQIHYNYEKSFEKSALDPMHSLMIKLPQKLSELQGIV